MFKKINTKHLTPQVTGLAFVQGQVGGEYKRITHVDCIPVRRQCVPPKSVLV